MTRVDFYVLPEAEDVGPVILICRLCDKAVAAGQKVYVHAEEDGLLADIDSALWNFRQNSFIAHEHLDDNGDCSPLSAVVLGAGGPPETHRDVLINIAAEPPRFFSSFTRVLEPVFGDSERRAQSRSRYGFYRERGYPLDTHRL